MIEFFADYGLFLLKAVTVVAAIVMIIGFAAATGRKAAKGESIEIEDLNERFRNIATAVKQVVFTKSDFKADSRARKEKAKAAQKAGTRRPRTFVIDFKGDLKASAAASLREEVSAILEVAEAQDDVYVRLDNSGGVVHEHGLAASQLARIRERNISLTVAVDKVAASGGYLMACVADRIVAAPFAILGSIGVLAQLPNFNRLLDSHGVDFEQITAGEYKRNVTMFGKNTDEDRARLKEQLEDVHELFKAAVTRYRPDLDLTKVATGEYWYGTRALELGLADELATSDEQLAAMAGERDLYRISYKIKQTLQKRLMGGAEASLERFDAARWRRRFEARLPR